MVAPPLTGPMFDVLTLLLRAGQEGAEVHGWQIMKAVRRSGPSVYGVLDRLEDAGWITGTWEELPPGDERPRRRYYRLTGAGAEAATRALATPRSPAPGPRSLRPYPGFGPAAHLKPAR